MIIYYLVVKERKKCIKTFNIYIYIIFVAIIRVRKGDMLQNNL